VTSRKNIAALQVDYYRLSREHRAFIIARAEELAAREAPPPGQENREKPGAVHPLTRNRCTKNPADKTGQPHEAALRED
jgi:hypothetical protein